MIDIIFRRSRSDGSRFFNTGVRSFGNFWTYAQKAAKICNSPAITHQLARNKRILRARILKAKRIISDVRDRKGLAEFLKYGTESNFTASIMVRQGCVYPS